MQNSAVVMVIIVSALNLSAAALNWLVSRRNELIEGMCNTLARSIRERAGVQVRDARLASEIAVRFGLPTETQYDIAKHIAAAREANSEA